MLTFRNLILLSLLSSSLAIAEGKGKSRQVEAAPQIVSPIESQIWLTGDVDELQNFLKLSVNERYGALMSVAAEVEDRWRAMGVAFCAEPGVKIEGTKFVFMDKVNNCVNSLVYNSQHWLNNFDKLDMSVQVSFFAKFKRALKMMDAVQNKKQM